jgi:hypothetical protein
LADILLQVKGCTLVWSGSFRQAMKALAQSRGLPASIPMSVAVNFVKGKGLLLIRPAEASDQEPVPVRVSPQGRRMTSEHPAAFASLGVDLPDGILVEVPAIPYICPRHGHCLALQFQKATFLYRQSKGSAIGLQDE